MAASCPNLKLGHDWVIEPLRKLLRKQDAGKNWGAQEQGQLRSAMCSGQWTQSRLHKAGLAESPLCSLCGKANGTLAHRLLWCIHPALQDQRDKHVPHALSEKARAECTSGKVSKWDRCLFEHPRSKVADPPEAKFEWILWPEEGIASGTCFSDGSRVRAKEERFGSYA